MSGQDGPNQMALSLRGDAALLALLFQIGARYGVDQITVADCFPVQAVSLIQDDFGIGGFSAGTFGGAHNNFHHRLTNRAVRMADHYGRVRFRPTGWLPHVDIERLHSLGGGSFLTTARANAASTRSQSGSSGSL